MIQAFLINKTLDMSRIKTAIQVAHGATIYMSSIMSIQMDLMISPDVEEIDKIAVKNFQEWTFNKTMEKVIFEVTNDSLPLWNKSLNQRNIWNSNVYDDPNQDSITCIVIEPLPEEQFNKIFGHL